MLRGIHTVLRRNEELLEHVQSYTSRLNTMKTKITMT